jgi:hypothetical protein
MTLKKTITMSFLALAVGLFAALAMTAVAADAAPKAGEKLVPLEIELPKPMFVGTPKNIRSANLEKQTGKKRPPFMAPEGAENVAFEMELTGSDEEPIIGEMELITDGDKEGADGSYVEFGPGIQWVQIDLEQPCEIYAVVFWHYHSQARVYHDVVIKSADDADLIENVQTIYNNDHDNSSGLGVGKDKEYIETNDGRLVDAKRTQGRYIRLYSNGNTSNELNHMIEVEVWGKPLED